MDQHSISSLTLAAVAGHSVPVIKMGMVMNIEMNLAPRVHSDFEVARVTDCLDGTQLAVRNKQSFRGSCKLHSVPFRETSFYLLVNRHTGQPPRIVGFSFDTFTRNGNPVSFRVHSLNTDIFAWINAQHYTASCIAHHIADLILACPLSISSGHLLPRLEDAQFVLLETNLATLLHFTMYQSIQFAARFIVRRDNECTFRLAGVITSDFYKPLGPVGKLMHTTVLVEVANCLQPSPPGWRSYASLRVGAFWLII